MSPKNVLEFSTATSLIGKGELKEILSDSNSIARKRLLACGIPTPLSPLQSVALMLTRDYTEKDAKLIRRFFGGVPNVDQFRSTRWS